MEIPAPCLVAEKETALADISAAQLSGAVKVAIKRAAGDIRAKMIQPTFEQKRALFDILDVRVELEWNEDDRGISISCGLRLTEDGKRIPTWQSLTGVWGKLSYTMIH
jgi:hypothetical protein